MKGGSAGGGPSRLTFQIGPTRGPPAIVPLVFGGLALHLPGRAGRRGAVKALGAGFLHKVLGLRL